MNPEIKQILHDAQLDMAEAWWSSLHDEQRFHVMVTYKIFIGEPFGPQAPVMTQEDLDPTVPCGTCGTQVTQYSPGTVRWRYKDYCSSICYREAERNGRLTP